MTKALIIAAVIVALGGISWFAVSQNKGGDAMMQEEKMMEKTDGTMMQKDEGAMMEQKDEAMMEDDGAMMKAEGDAMMQK